MATDMQGLEFVIDGKKLELLGNYMNKIKKLFRVTITLKDHFPLQQSDDMKQWIYISGPVKECNSAKDYIIALTSPEYQIEVKELNNHPLFTEDRRELIERSSHTVLVTEDGSDDLKIYGTELSVALAQSLIDDVFKDFKHFQMYESDSGDSVIIEIDENETGDWDKNNSAPCAVSISQKSQVVSSLSTVKTNLSVYASPSVLSPVNNSGQETCHGYSVRKPAAVETSKAFPSLTGKPFCPQKETDRLKSDYSKSKESTSNQASSLRQLAHDLHYAPEVIERGLLLYDMNNIVKPADFLKTLNFIKASPHSGLDVIRQASLSAVASGSIHPANVNSNCDLNDSVIFIREEEHSIVSDPITISDEDEDVEMDGAGTARIKNPGLQERNQDSSHSRTKSIYPTQIVLPLPAAANNIQTFDSLATEEITSPKPDYRTDLRYIVIDGSNVAMSHGESKFFSVRGIEIAVKYFQRRGHDRITVFVPEWRRYVNATNPIRGKHLLEKLNQEGILKFTPARRVEGRTIASYDDRYILNLAEQEDGIIVSNDLFRDLCEERPSYKNIVHQNLLQFIFVKDAFMPPDDPLGRNGPKLDLFLRTPFTHFTMNGPFQELLPPNGLNSRNTVREHFNELRLNTAKEAGENFNGPIRSREVTQKLFDQLIQVFPNTDQSMCVYKVLQNHSAETDLVKLTNYVMNAMFT
ncbi:hypothetical protein Btru_068089 [Bulinus truncatus]|nr:hypothetical protein Btru_068089 [Bulinus truncatus]